MDNKNNVELTLTQKELAILHSALIDYRCKLGNLIGQVAGMGLDTEEATQLSNQLRDLSDRICDLLTE